MDLFRGYPIYMGEDGRWRFSDTKELTEDTWFKRPCGHCGLMGNSNDGLPDPCLGELAGVTNACCGHGNPSESYMCFSGGLVIRGFSIEKPHHRSLDPEEIAEIRKHNDFRRQFHTYPPDTSEEPDRGSLP